MKKKFLCLILTFVMVFSLIPSAVATANDDATEAAETLYALGLFRGTGTNADGTPIFALEQTPSRNQAVIMLVRLLGKEQEALTGNWELPFTDVPKGSTAYPYIGYAYANGLTNGTSATTYSGGNPIRANQYITFVLRAMGYVSGEDFTVSTAWEFSDEIGLTDGTYSAATKTFTRGDVARISCDALEVSLANKTMTLAEKLIGEGLFAKAKYEFAKRGSITVPWSGGTAAFSGRGTSKDPYRIETPEQLAELAVRVNKGNPFENAWFRLEKDLDLRGIEWTPIGDFGHMFSGKFDGNGHTISNLYISKHTPEYIGDWNEWHDTYSAVGLFSTVGSAGEIKNLSVDGEIAISVKNAPDKESISAGGIVGCLYGKVSNCDNACNVMVESDSKDAYMQAGGIVGIYGMESVVDHCGNTGEIYGKGVHVVRVGGIAGDSDGKDILTNCWNIGTVTAKGSGGVDIGAGGMTCHTYDTIVANCYNLGTVTSDGRAGGILAYQIGSDSKEEQPEIYNCYSAGTVRGQGGATGSICGKVYKGTIRNVFWTESGLKAVGGKEGNSIITEAENIRDAQQMLERLNSWIDENTDERVVWSAWKLDGNETWPTLCE